MNNKVFSFNSIIYILFLLLFKKTKSDIKEECKGYKVYSKCEGLRLQKEDRENEQRLVARCSNYLVLNFHCIPSHIRYIQNRDSYQYILIHPQYYEEDGFVDYYLSKKIKSVIHLSNNKIQRVSGKKVSAEISGIYKCLVIKNNETEFEFIHYLSLSRFASVVKRFIFEAEVSNCVDYRLSVKAANILRNLYIDDLLKINKNFNVIVKPSCQLGVVNVSQIFHKKSTQMERNVVEYYKTIGLDIKTYKVEFNFDVWLNPEYVPCSCANCPESATKKLLNRALALLNSKIKHYATYIDDNFANLHQSDTIITSKRVCFPGEEPLHRLNPGKISY